MQKQVLENFSSWIEEAKAIVVLHSCKTCDKSFESKLSNEFISDIGN